jgi:hypothetical protein
MTIRTHTRLLSVLHMPVKDNGIKLGCRKRTVQVIGALVLCCTLCMTVFAGKQDSQESCASSDCEVIYYEDWEDGLGDWGAPAVWEICAPRACPPPDSARSGDNCVATVCCGDYPSTFPVRLESPLIYLRDTIAGEVTVTRFWHWFSSLGDMEFQVMCNDSIWVTKFSAPHGDNTQWTLSPVIDLTECAGQTVRIGFSFEFHGLSYRRGWYVDDILIEICGFGCHAGDDTTICRGESVQFLDANVDNGVPPYIYSWTPCEGLSDCSILKPTASTESTTKNVGNECWDTVVVTVLAAPEVDLRDTTINIGVTLVLDAGGPYESYQWSTSANTRTISFTPTMVGDSLFWVEVSHEGCTVVDSAVVHVIDTSGPTNVIASEDDCDKVVITWNDNSTYEEGYRVYRNGTQVCDVGPNIKKCTDYPDPGNYMYCVHLYQGAYESPDSPEACDEGVRLDVPFIPTNVTASTDMFSAVRIEWSPAEFATSYCVYRDDQQIRCTAATTYVDQDIEIGKWYSYCVVSVNNCGESECSWVDSGMALTDVVMEDVSVYPNPTGAVANITYTLYENAEVTIELFTLRGRKIWDFTASDAADGSGGSVGTHVVAWDIKNEVGSVVANGVYICRITATGTASGKTVEVNKKISVVK